MILTDKINYVIFLIATEKKSRNFTILWTKQKIICKRIDQRQLITPFDQICNGI